MRKKRWLRSTLSLVLAAVMCLGLTLSGNLGRVLAEDTEGADLSTFQLYYYDDSEDIENLYVDIWNHEGITFGENAVTDDSWGWNNPQAVMQPVSGNAGWYVTEITIIDGSKSDGFSIYKNGSSSDDVAIQYDNQWNNTEDYQTLIGKSDTSYAIKNGTLHTDLAEAGIVFEDLNTFQLYYYDDSEDIENLYVDIWNHEGITFGENAVTDDSWGWNNPQAVMQPVSGNAGWYVTEITIIDGSKSDGFSIYKNGSSSDDVAIQYDNQWNNTEDYQTLVGKTSTAYAINEGTLYTDLTEAGLNISEEPEEPEEPADLSALTELIGKVPVNYETDGFKAETVAALKTALEAAEACTEASDSETIDTCYKNLQTALNALVYSDDTIVVKKVDNLSDNFIKGIDISSYISETNSGVVYRDWDGNEVDGVGFIKLFADTGVNYIRLRVWNAPYMVNADGTPATDANGNIKWYGGGNNSLDTTKEICEMIAEYNSTYSDDVKVLIDFHYSDFWADPDKQEAPKAWKNITDINELTAKVKEFTIASLTEIASTGVTIGMVQVGNETNNGICGQDIGTTRYYEVFKAGCEAVKEYDSNILRVVHYTDPQKEDNAVSYAKALDDAGVDYDVYATSYYPFWHGTTDNLYEELNKIATQIGKQVMVAETQYVYTNEDYDGADNQAYEGKENIDLSGWPVSVQGQANEIRDVIAAVAKVSDNKGIGMFYWEPAWLGVGNAYDADGNLDKTKLEENRNKWNVYGSGWATDYAAEYDISAAQWGGGGTNNENASLFNFTGNPLPSLNVFKYVNYGSEAPLTFYQADSLDEQIVLIGASEEEIRSILPTTVGYLCNDQKTKGTANITWNEERIKEVVTALAANSAVGLSMLIDGTINIDGTNHTVSITVTAEPKENLLVNGAFEEQTSWEIENNNILWYDTENPRNGSQQAIAFNTYSVDGLEADENGCYAGNVSQTVDSLPAGVYEARLYFEGLSGAGSKQGEYLNISVKCGDQIMTSDNVVLQGWMIWQTAVVSNIVITDEMVKTGANSITLYANVSIAEKVWGTFDDFYLYRIGDAPVSDDTGSTNTPTTPTTPTDDTTITVTGNPQYDGWAGVSAEQKAKLMQESLAQNAAVTAPKTDDNAPLAVVIMLLMAGAVIVVGTVSKKTKLS